MSADGTVRPVDDDQNCLARMAARPRGSGAGLAGARVAERRGGAAHGAGELSGGSASPCSHAASLRSDIHADDACVACVSCGTHVHGASSFI